MKILWSLIIAVALAVAVIVALPFLRGYVLIRTGGWSVEMNIFVLVVGILTVFATIKLLVWLWYLPGNTLRNFIQKRAIAQLELGMLALSQGDWRKAEKALKQSAKRKDQASLSYLGAAQAAQERGDEVGMEVYLEKADQSTNTHQPVQITRAQLLLASKQPKQALAVLDSIRKPRESRIKILELLAICYEKLERWSDLQAIVPNLLKTNILDSTQANHLLQTAAAAQLNAPADGQSIDQVWESFDRKLRQTQSILSEYADKAIKTEKHDLVEKELRLSLNQNWDEALIMRYAQLKHCDSAIRNKHCQQWLKRHSDSAGVHLALGLLSQEIQQWDQAIEHFQTSSDLEPTLLAFQGLAGALAETGEHERANRAYKRALITRNN